MADTAIRKAAPLNVLEDAFCGWFREASLRKSCRLKDRVANLPYNTHMGVKKQPRRPMRWYRGADVPRGVIRRFVRQVVERFRPEKIVLFGSYAYGKPHADSDVDILVVMPARNQLDQAAKIHVTLLPPFPLDIIVRTPKNMQWRLAEGDSFLQEVVSQGKVLYEKNNQGVGTQGRGRSPRRRRAAEKRSFTA
jgi:predicted nucleotidyltransferase